jgi:metal-responsive CopG/Arc/MetJ family transcriptional regulator
MNISLRLPEDLVEDLNGLADECECSRTEIIETILDYVMDKESLVDEIFPYEKEEVKK